MLRLFFLGLLASNLTVGCGGESSSVVGTGGTGGVGGLGGNDTGGSGGIPAACDQRAAQDGETGGQCVGDTFECDGDLVCLGEQSLTIGPGIANHPNGADYSFEVLEFPGDYCTGALPPSFPDTECSEQNAIACAEVCGLCVPRFTDSDICLRGCQAEVDTNSTCREGYQCDLLLEVCDTGCSSDDDCRVSVNDSDEPEYDTESTFVCNAETGRCEHPGTPGAEAGIACSDDQECEARGICLDEEEFGFTGGYCSKIRCDIDPCAGGGVCAGLGLGVPLCAETCEVGAGATLGDPSTYLNNTQGCREGYTCFWTGTEGDPAGVCVPGEFNDITQNNVGAACVESSECYSPFGQGTCGDAAFVCTLTGEDPSACRVGFGCTVLDCAVPGMPEDVCGDDAECVVDEAAGLSLCVERCESAESCLPGAACGDLDGDPATLDTVCLPFCVADTECRAGETCNVRGECTAAL